MKLSLLLIAGLLSSGSFAGNYLEFKLKAKTGPGMQDGVKGTMKAWYQNGNTRTQLQMEMEQGGNSMATAMMNKMVGLRLSSQPNTSFLLDENNKIYFEAPKKNDGQEEEITSWDISVIGQEKLNGYNCTRIKATEKTGSAPSEFEWWVSKDVPGYSELKDFRTKQLNTGAIYQALKGKGIDGFPVKIKMTGSNPGRPGIPMEIELIKAEIMDIPESRFSLEGYTRKEGLPFMPGGMDPEKLKNMSPAERMKFLGEMQRKMQGMQPEKEEDKE